ncbi:MULTISPECIES: MarR family transcriptional regulator [Streptomyces]|uniref:MarR family transcriptional regulator n=1 Tax=Streptomyces TaxID=1883 RepID=UPI00292D8617|nr:MarR family transcriptional regulator [Streptomyces sp. NEAU-HV9]
MSDVRDSLDRAGYGRLAHALTVCGREGFTGELRVPGSPGGAFHLRDGLVVAAESPGAPAPEALLLRSDRIDGAQWAELVRESGGARWPAAGLIAHGYAGAAQLRVVCVMALHDAAFAIVAGQVDGCETATDTEPHAPVAVGETPARLLQEAVRKLAAVAALPYPVRPDRERPLAVAPADRARTPLQQELLVHADGRRTARDLAFRTGRGVYTVTVEVARMLGEGLLECAAPADRTPVRMPMEAPVVRHREPPPRAPDPEPPPAPIELPRREPGASGITEALAPTKSGTSWKGFFRLRHGTAK